MQNVEIDDNNVIYKDVVIIGEYTRCTSWILSGNLIAR